MLKREFARKQSEMQKEMADLRAKMYTQDARLLELGARRKESSETPKQE